MGEGPRAVVAEQHHAVGDFDAHAGQRDQGRAHRGIGQAIQRRQIQSAVGNQPRGLLDVAAAVAQGAGV